MKSNKLLLVILALFSFLQSKADVEINETNFPDSNFREYLKAQTYGADGVITDSEIADITSISVSEKQISNLQGIEYFTALKSLACYNNQLSTLDVSKNTTLTSLYCDNNQLTSLDVSKNTALTSLSCPNNQLTSLDVSKNTELTILTCSSNRLTSLDVSKNVALRSLTCYSNRLTSLDVSKNLALRLMNCSSNLLNSLDVSNNEGLANLLCYNNQLTSLDVSKNTALTLLSCYSNQIRGEAMDALVASLPSTENGSLYIIYNENEGNEMTPAQVAAAKAKGWIPQYYNGYNKLDYSGAFRIDETNFPDPNFREYLKTRTYGADGVITGDEIAAIKSMTVNSMQISDLQGIEYFTALKSIQCLFNQLSSLDFSKNIALTSVSCAENQLTSLDVSKNTALTSLGCQNNQLTSLDVSKNTALTSLSCPKNQLTSLDVSKNTALTSLYCYNNQLTSLDVSKNTALTSLGCDRNKLTSFDVSKNTALTYLSCYSNQIRGEAMDALVASLPSTEYGSLCIIYNENEGNEMTAAQVAAAKAKGWIPQYYNGASWGDYAGYDAVIEINETNFPDENFREYLKTQSYGTDGVISIAEFVDIKTMDVSSKQIASLKGIEYFTCLTKLNCCGNQLTSLDVSRNSKLTYLVCDDNKLTSLDVSKNTALMELYCQYNQLSSLDMSNNIALTDLACYDNQLISLDLSKNSALTYLDCANNQLTSLDLSKNTELTELRCENNQLKSLDVSNTAMTAFDCYSNQIIGEAMDALIKSLPIVEDGSLVIIQQDNEGNEITGVQVFAAKAKGWTSYRVDGSCSTPIDIDIDIDETNFPDPNFRSFLQAQTYGKDGVITDEEFAAITSMDVSCFGISNLKGIEFFSALKSLYCDNSKLTSLDVSKNTRLMELLCQDNQLTSLDVSKNTALTYLVCSNNQLTSLDLTKNSALTYLDCANNQLTSLDLSKNTELTELRCEDNQLTSLDVSKNTALTSLSCLSNQLTYLDVSNNTALTSLYCDDNQLTSLDVSKNTALKTLYCSSNQLTSLDVSKNTALTSLYCEVNQLTSLDVSKNTALMELYCYYNQLTSLDVSKNTALTSLDCYYNELTSLDISKNTALKTLHCNDNKLSSLDVSKNTALTKLDCYSNQIKYDEMDALVASLPIVENRILKIVNKSNDGNYMTTAQVTAAKAKGWIPKYQVSYGNWSDFSGGVVINYVNFPDNFFNDYLMEQSYGKDGVITDAEIATVNTLWLDNKKILNLKGIEFFTALTFLSCDNNRLSTLDVSKNTSLTSLSCAGNQLTFIDVSKNALLYSLNCSSNQLTSLDVSNNTALTKLYFSTNQIRGEAMDALVASLPTVEDGLLGVRNNGDDGNVITTIQVAAAKAKGWISKYFTGADWLYYYGSCVGVEISEKNFPDANFCLYLKKQPYGADGILTDEEIADITSISVINKQITNLKGIEYFSSLTSLSCDDNQLTSLDVSNNTALIELSCGRNKLISLDVSNNTALTFLNCSNNQLTSLDVSKNTMLKELWCYDNMLESLDVSNNSLLEELYCYDNMLESLDVSKNTELTLLWCSNNQLTSLDISKNVALTYLWCNNNRLTSLNVSKNTLLKELWCYSNQIKYEGMDTLVKSMQTINYVVLKILNDKNEENIMTISQVSAAKGKGWFPEYFDGSKWVNYAGKNVKFKLTYMVDGVEYKSFDIEYGATITPETAPEKETYRFTGWSEIPETMPSHDVTVTGTFERYFTVGNVVNLINFIMNSDATEDDVELYDQNADDELNIGDIILVVKWILNNNENKENPSLSRTRSYDVPDFTQYTAVQFDVKVAAGTNIKEMRLVKSMEQTHQMMYQQKDANTYTVVVYSLSNQLMKPENGNIVEITTDKNTLNGVSIENVIVALPTGETESYNGAHLSTNILQIEGEEGPAVVYDLKGNRQNGTKGLKKGVYIVNGKKVIVK